MVETSPLLSPGLPLSCPFVSPGEKLPPREYWETLWVAGDVVWMPEASHRPKTCRSCSWSPPLPFQLPTLGKVGQ